MSRLKFLLLTIFLMANACTLDQKNPPLEKWKQEVIDAEQQFAVLVKKEGIHKAFMAFAADDAVLMRNNKVVVGKDEIDAYFTGQTMKEEDISLSWKPDFVDVAASGDMAYTYGQYTFIYKDSVGNPSESTGIFHTVWKRQADGSWKFVWD